MPEGTSMSHDRHGTGSPYPWLLEASGGTYHVHGGCSRRAAGPIMFAPS